MKLNSQNQKHIAQQSIPTAEANQNRKLFASLHRDSLGSPRQVQCLRKIGSYSVTALAVVKAHLLGETPYRELRVCLNVIHQKR
ncbi:MAG: hypothetical protein H7A23_14015 [Leptospiraceae bacterium]|nr:hypothetical protein [Leptospiraceae bacterium]